jgi:hypothetical protein
MIELSNAFSRYLLINTTSKRGSRRSGNHQNLFAGNNTGNESSQHLQLCETMLGNILSISSYPIHFGWILTPTPIPETNFENPTPRRISTISLLLLRIWMERSDQSSTITNHCQFSYCHVWSPQLRLLAGLRTP